MQPFQHHLTHSDRALLPSFSASAQAFRRNPHHSLTWHDYPHKACCLLALPFSSSSASFFFFFFFFFFFLLSGMKSPLYRALHGYKSYKYTAKNNTKRKKELSNGGDSLVENQTQWTDELKHP
ncbi:hypothetical protein INR49_005431 [Caranx melampygus]|nr:hypothetical protein INR49_005431 [Caranx melampygus]